MKKRLKKKRLKKEIKSHLDIMSKLVIHEDDVLHVDKNGVIQIDFDNKRQVEIHRRWMED